MFPGAVGWLLIDAKMPSVFAGNSAPQAEIAVYSGKDPNARCAACHQAIYERYRTAPMANASGPAAEGFLPGGFTHVESGVSYRMAERDGRVYLQFDRAGGFGSQDDRPLRGERELRYFVGSGKRGRTYLFEQEGYWFESPVNWYAKKRVWDMAPNYLHVREMPLALPVDPGCLRCHSSEAQPSLPEARNRYASVPFLESGITCTACHGDAAAHLASGGHTAMLRIEELPPVRRDSVCLSCHLEGQEAVVHAGKRVVDFRPGDNLFDTVSFFVRASQPDSSERATSQWEALLKSGCKRGAGDRLTCTSCHDPHSSPRAEERVAFYRARCLACHDPEAAKVGNSPDGEKGFAATHHPENPDCTACHMPRVRAEDIAHEQVTDHQILRIPRAKNSKNDSRGDAAETLLPIGTVAGMAGTSSDRNLGLAYALAASRGDRIAGERALKLLLRAERLPDSAADAELHERLGFLDQVSGEKELAAREYALALTADAHDAVAAGNLALLKAGEGQYGAAIELWQRAFEDDPAQSKAGMNLAIVECGVGRKDDALATLQRIVAFSPDDGEARELDREIRAGTHPCRAR